MATLKALKTVFSLLFWFLFQILRAIGLFFATIWELLMWIEHHCSKRTQTQSKDLKTSPEFRIRTSLVRSLHGERYIIDYCDYDGEQTSRTVRMLQLRKTYKGDLLLLCYCELRCAPRHFRLDRITSVADMNGILQEPLNAFWHRTLEIDLPRSFSQLVRTTVSADASR